MRGKWSKSVLAGVALAALLAGCGPLSQRVGWVDGTRVIRVTRRGTDIRNIIKKEGAVLEGKLEQLRAGIKVLAAEVRLLKKTKTAKDPVLMRKQRALGLASRQLRALHLRYQKQLNEHGQRLLEEFKETIRKVAMAIRRQLGLDLVIMTSRGEGLWIWPVENITDKVIRRLDKNE